MKLDKLQAVLRERTSFEAIDLGFSMFRRWAGLVYRSWFIGVAPWFVLVWALLHGHPFWAFFLLWWLKPLWDRIPLFIVSRALFGDTPGTTETLRALPKLLSRHLGHSLLIYRLDPARSFFLPVLELEGSDRQMRPRRRAALMRTMGGPAAWLTLVCLCLDIAVLFGLIGLVLILLPDAPEYAVSFLWERFWDGEAPLWLQITFPITSFLSLTIVEPLYVSAGFSLYLNRRTRLEGWDIELTFRRIAARLENTRKRAAKTVVTFLAVLTLGAAIALASVVAGEATAFAQSSQSSDQQGSSVTPHVPDGQAQPAPPVPPAQPEQTQQPLQAQAPVDAQGTPEAVIKRMLTRPEFEHRAKRSFWRRRNPVDERTSQPPAWLEWLGRLVSSAIEGFLWVVAGIVLAGVIVLIISRLRRMGPRAQGSRKKKLPEPKAGKTERDLDGEPLPDDIPGAAIALIGQGRVVDALGLLYRGALAALVEQKIAIEENATEGECLRVVQSKAEPPTATFFEALTKTWQEAAYAHRSIDERHLNVLCAQWPHHFGGRQ